MIHNTEQSLASQRQAANELAPAPGLAPSDGSDKPSSIAWAHLTEAVRDANRGEQGRINQDGIEQIEDLTDRARLVLCQVLQQQVREEDNTMRHLLVLLLLLHCRLQPPPPPPEGGGATPDLSRAAAPEARDEKTTRTK